MAHFYRDHLEQAGTFVFDLDGRRISLPVLATISVEVNEPDDDSTPVERAWGAFEKWRIVAVGTDKPTEGA